MNQIWTVAKREITSLLSNRRILFSILIFIVAWSLISLPRLIGNLRNHGDAENTIFYLASLLCLYVIFVLSGQAFLGDKRESRIETLLCTPLTIRTFWLGKVIGVVIPAYVIGIVLSLIIAVISGVRTGSVTLPGGPLVAYVTVSLPVILAGFAGLLGFFQFIMGLRENRIINIVMLIIMFGGLGAASSLIGAGGFMTWPLFLVFTAGGAVFFFLVSLLTRFISKEKIITSLE